MMIAHYMTEQTKRYGAKFKEAVEITDIDLANKTCVVDGFETIKAKKIVIATGSRPRPLGLPGEKEYGGNGISYCATCDGKYVEDQEEAYAEDKIEFMFSHEPREFREYGTDDMGVVVEDLRTDADMKTNIIDVYAAGDVATKKFRQITTAVSDGTIAAINISKELAG